MRVNFYTALTLIALSAETQVEGVKLVANAELENFGDLLNASKEEDKMGLDHNAIYDHFKKTKDVPNGKKAQKQKKAYKKGLRQESKDAHYD